MPAQEVIADHSQEYRLLDWLRADCEYFLGAGARAEKHLWAGNVRAQIAKLRELYESLPEKPEWLTKKAIDDYAERMAPPYQVIAYHHMENGFDEKPDFQTLQEAEAAVQGYVDGTIESDGFAYDGAAIYDQQTKRYLRIYGDYPDERAHRQVEGNEQIAPMESAIGRDLLTAAYSVGDTLYLEDGAPFVIESIGLFDVSLRDPTLLYPVSRAESKESLERLKVS